MRDFELRLPSPAHFHRSCGMLQAVLWCPQGGLKEGAFEPASGFSNPASLSLFPCWHTASFLLSGIFFLAHVPCLEAFHFFVRWPPGWWWCPLYLKRPPTPTHSQKYLDRCRSGWCVAWRTSLSEPPLSTSPTTTAPSSVMANFSPRVWVAHKVRRAVCSAQGQGFMLVIVE